MTALSIESMVPEVDSTEEFLEHEVDSYFDDSVDFDDSGDFDEFDDFDDLNDEDNDLDYLEEDELNDEFEDLCPVEELPAPGDIDDLPELLFADDSLDYTPVPEECIGIASRSSAIPGGAGSGLVQFVLQPVGNLPAGVTLANLMNVQTVLHPLFANATTTAQATAINGAFGRDAIFLGESANRNRFRIMIGGFEGYVNREGAEHTVTVNGQSVRVRASAVFVPFNNYPNNTDSSTVRSASHYINRNGELWRNLSTNVNNTNFQTFLAGTAPSWMAQNTRYYSYDGVYFYTNPRHIRPNGSGAVNANNPHFNYFQYLSFRSQSTVTAAQLNNFLTNQSLHGINTSNSVMRNQGSAFINAQNRYGINAMLMYAKAMLESAGGTSSIARNNNNLFGLGAVDSAPGANAWHFASPAASVNDLANGWLSRGYLWPEDWRYEGPHSGHKGSGMNVRYAMDPYWGEKIAGWAFRIDRSRPSGTHDRNREQIAIRRNTSTVSVQNAAGTRLYTANPRGGRYFPFLVTGTSGDRLRVQTDPAIVNGVINRTALYNRINSVGFIPTTDAWLTGAGNPAGTAPATPDPAPQFPITGMVQPGITRRNASFREGPGAGFNEISVVKGSTNVRITGRSGVWFRVIVNGTTGWMRQTAVLRTRPNAVVTTDNAAVRAGRGDSYRVLTRAPRASRVRVQRRSAHWSRITINGQTGWIRNRDLAIDNAMRPGRTIANNVRVHTRPNGESAVRRSLPRHTQLMIIQRTTDGWSQVQIRHNGGTFHGWARTNELELRVHTRRMAENGVLRSGPGTNFNSLRVIPRNTNVTVRSRVGNWYHVHLYINGRKVYGWQHHNNLQRLTLP